MTERLPQCTAPDCDSRSWRLTEVAKCTREVSLTPDGYLAYDEATWDTDGHIARTWWTCAKCGALGDDIVTVELDYIAKEGSAS